MKLRRIERVEVELSTKYYSIKSTEYITIKPWESEILGALSLLVVNKKTLDDLIKGLTKLQEVLGE